ncbi:MAG: hypothetical protein ABIR57_12890 [Aeromicrobium sp.]
MVDGLLVLDDERRVDEKLLMPLVRLPANRLPDVCRMSARLIGFLDELHVCTDQLGSQQVDFITVDFEDIQPQLPLFRSNYTPALLLDGHVHDRGGWIRHHSLSQAN